MTIVGWIVFVVLSLAIFAVGFSIFIAAFNSYKKPKLKAAITAVVTLVLIAALLFGMLWYFNNTASGKRALVDQKSNFNNGIDRVITIYTANGDLIATYSGKIDIETNDGGYIKFDFEGKRYIYYNCFVECIAEIN